MNIQNMYISVDSYGYFEVAHIKERSIDMGSKFMMPISKEFFIIVRTGEDFAQYHVYENISSRMEFDFPYPKAQLLFKGQGKVRFTIEGDIQKMTYTKDFLKDFYDGNFLRLLSKTEKLTIEETIDSYTIPYLNIVSIEKIRIIIEYNYFGVPFLFDKRIGVIEYHKGYPYETYTYLSDVIN